MIDWKIQARAHACQACARPFADKQPYFTLLFDRRQGLERLDVCAACWESQYGPGANSRKDFLSFWQGVFAEPAPPAPEPIQKETAESLLRRWVAQKDPEHAAACYILAVMLERKRLLKVKAQTTENGQRTWVYEHARNGDLFTIPDPDLQLDRLDEVQRAVAQMLEEGLNPPAPATPPVPLATAPSDQTVGMDPGAAGPPAQTIPVEETTDPIPPQPTAAIPSGPATDEPSLVSPTP